MQFEWQKLSRGLNFSVSTLCKRFPLLASHPLHQWASRNWGAYSVFVVAILNCIFLSHHRTSCLDSFLKKWVWAWGHVVMWGGMSQDCYDNIYIFSFFIFHLHFPNLTDLTTKSKTNQKIISTTFHVFLTYSSRPQQPSR